MAHNDKKDMCVSEEKVEKIVNNKINLLKSDLTGLLNTSFGEVNKDLEYIKKQTTETNSRTTTNEKEITQLKKHRLTRELDCPFKPRMVEMGKERVAQETMKDYLDSQEEKFDRERNKFYNKMQGYGAVILVAVALLAFGADILRLVKDFFTG